MSDGLSVVSIMKIVAFGCSDLTSEWQELGRYNLAESKSNLKRLIQLKKIPQICMKFSSIIADVYAYGSSVRKYWASIQEFYIRVLISSVLVWVYS